VGRGCAELETVEKPLTAPKLALLSEAGRQHALPLPTRIRLRKAARVRVVKEFADTYPWGVRPAERSLLESHPC
jgi:hypothetical protein